MAFFDELSKRVNGIAQSAQKTAEIAKIQHQIAQKQAEFDSIYHQIGQLYYSCHQRNVVPDESIDALCDRVTAMAQEIDKLKGRIDELNGVRRCASCGSVIDSESKFCSKCGAKVAFEPAPQPEAAPETADETASGIKSEDKDVYINWPEANPAPAGSEEPEAPADEPAEADAEAPANESAEPDAEAPADEPADAE